MDDNSRFFILLLLITSLYVTACVKKVPKEDLPAPLVNETIGEESKVVIIPLPVIASNPNEGFTWGALTSFLLYNKEDEVHTLLAPQVNYNPHYGVTATLYGSVNPSPSRSWEFNVSRSTHVNEDYEIRYIDRAFQNNKRLEVNVFPYYFTDGSARFFGFQSSSQETNETNFGDQEFGITLSFGYRLAKRFQLVIGERIRQVNVVQGAVTSIPFIRDKYSPEEVPGINGFFTHAQKLSFIYSSLNSPIFPSEGLYARASIEQSAQFLGSSVSFSHYELESKVYFPLDAARYISIFRLVYNQIPGDDVPFLERAILGGEMSLRGYGRGRFIDSSSLLFNLEERIRLFRWEVFNVEADWEIAPFIDIGEVMKSLSAVRWQDFKVNPGIGFRAIVRPNIVGRIDIGFGDEGPALFIGLGYPF